MRVSPTTWPIYLWRVAAAGVAVLAIGSQSLAEDARSGQAVANDAAFERRITEIVRLPSLLRESSSQERREFERLHKARVDALELNNSIRLMMPALEQQWLYVLSEERSRRSAP